MSQISRLRSGSRSIVIALATLLLASLARSDNFQKVRYEIQSTLDFAALSLSECAMIRFESGSTLPETLYFWQAEIDENMTAIMDSIKVNGSLFYIGHVSSAIKDKNVTSKPIASNDLSYGQLAGCVYGQVRREDENDYFIPISAANFLLLGMTNEIQFYYRLLFSDPPQASGINFSGAFPYCEFYPRLVKSNDRITSFDQRYNSVEEFKLQVHVPENSMLLSEPEPDSVVEVHDNKVYYLPNYSASQVVWFAIRDSYYRKIESDGHIFHTYLDSQQRPNEDLISECASSLDFFELLFGSFPYSRYNLIVVPLSDDIAGAAIGNFIFTGNHGSSQPIFDLTARLFPLNETAVSHEVAHLWWGCKVSIIDQWFGEAMASFWSRRYQKEKSGGKAVPYPGDDLYQFVNRITLISSATGLGDDYPASAGYYKGPHILEMLALEIGEDSMASICRQYYEQFRGKEADFRNFRELVTRVSPESETFFSHWVDSGHTQNISISSVASMPRGEYYENSLQLRRTGDAYSRIPVMFEYEDGEKEFSLLHSDSLLKTWNSARRLKSVRVDPENLLLESRRADNGWPGHLRFYAPTLNPFTNISNAVEFVFHDAPYYHMMILPCLVSHTNKSGWSCSALLAGREEIIYGSPLRGRKIFVARTGYNSRMNSFAGSSSWQDILSEAGGVSLYYSLKTGQENGQRYAGIGASASLKSAAFYRPYSEINFSVFARRFLALPDISSGSWPTRVTYPFIAEWSFQAANTKFLSNFAFQSKLRVEFALPVGNRPADYSRKEWQVRLDRKFLDLGFMLGSARGSIAQERFDLSQEGRLLSLPPFRHYYDEILLLSTKKGAHIVSQFRVNLWANYVDDLKGKDRFVEAGYGIRFGDELWVEASFPLYSDFRGIEQNRWDWRRLRIRASLFVSEPIFDFRIR